MLSSIPAKVFTVPQFLDVPWWETESLIFGFYSSGPLMNAACYIVKTWLRPVFGIYWYSTLITIDNNDFSGEQFFTFIYSFLRNDKVTFHRMTLSFRQKCWILNTVVLVKCMTAFSVMEAFSDYSLFSCGGIKNVFMCANVMFK